MKSNSSGSLKEKSSDFVVSESTFSTTGPSNQTENILTEEKISESTSNDYSLASKSGIVHRWVQSYKRQEESEVTSDFEDGKSVASVHLKKSMKSRHVVMMSIGTGIGTGLLISNAKGLAISGPAPLVIGYGMVSFITYFMIQAAGELAVTYPTLPGNFNSYFCTLVSKPFGFATVWLACVQWITVLPLELIAASMTIKYWTNISGDAFVVIIYVFLMLVHLLDVRAYCETEFIFNACKVLMIAGFIILSILINCGAAGNDGYIGGRYWNDPGAFASDNPASRFKSICYILVTGYFSYGGTELFVLSVNEQANPRKSTPQAAKHCIYRILIIYLTTMILIGFNVPHNSDQLLGNNNSGANVSPYVLAASIHGVKIVPHIINAIILIALVSVANSSLYAATRMMVSLSQQSLAPKWLGYVDREGRPLAGLAVCALFGFIGFAASSSYEDQIFTWLAAIAGLSELFTWSAFFISHIRFRQAMSAQGKDLNELGFRATTGVYGSYFGICFNILVFMSQFWVALAPIGNDGKVSVESFFEGYLAFPLWLFFYFGCMFWFRDFKLFNPLSSIDLDFHRRIYDPEALKREDDAQREKRKNSSLSRRLVYFFC